MRFTNLFFILSFLQKWSIVDSNFSCWMETPPTNRDDQFYYSKCECFQRNFEDWILSIFVTRSKGSFKVSSCFLASERKTLTVKHEMIIFCCSKFMEQVNSWRSSLNGRISQINRPLRSCRCVRRHTGAVDSIDFVYLKGNMAHIDACLETTTDQYEKQADYFREEKSIVL